MAELADALFRGDSWDFPGMRTTQILHTTSEDCNAESPVQAKVEEQSAFRAANILSAPNTFAETGNSPVAGRQATFRGLGSSNIAGDVASVAGPDTLANSMPLNLTFSNSSNSTNCCIPSVSPQAATCYDIKASAQVAEHTPSSNSLFPTSVLQQQQARALNGNSQAPPLSAANAARLHQFMASVFDDVDSGRIQHTDMSTNPFPGSALPHREHNLLHSGSFPPEVRGYFPAIDQPSQQVLQTQFLAQQLLEQQQQRQQAGQQQQQQQPPFAQQSTPFQHRAQHQAAAHRRGSAAPQWQQPLSNSAADSEQSRKAAKQNRSRVEAQHQLDDLDLSGLKRDFSSFSSPSSQGKPNRQAATRRAHSFTHGSAASVTTASPASTARKPRGAASSSQAAASGSRVASPLTSMASLPDSDVSVSEAEGHSGAEEADGSKRQRVVKGRRGARVARRMLCKNCGAHQTPQWRCGPLGPRTLCNACGVRYKKGLPLTGTARSAELA